jgi:hypothetical protein
MTIILSLMVIGMLLNSVLDDEKAGRRADIVDGVRSVERLLRRERDQRYLAALQMASDEMTQEWVTGAKEWDADEVFRRARHYSL